MEKVYKLLNNKNLVATIFAFLASLVPMSTLGFGSLASVKAVFEFLAYIGLFIIVFCEYKNINLKSESLKYIPIVLIIIATLIDIYIIGIISIGNLTSAVSCGIFIFINLTYINKFANLIENKSIYLKMAFVLSIVAIFYGLFYLFLWNDLGVRIKRFCEMIMWIIILIFINRKNKISKKYTLMCFFICTIGIIIYWIHFRYQFVPEFGFSVSFFNMIFFMVSEISYSFAVCFIISIINYIFTNEKKMRYLKKIKLIKS